VCLTGVIAVAVLTGASVRQDMLTLLVLAAAAGLVTLVSFRWPVLALGVFAALVPIEEVIYIDGLGTLSRFAGILFAVTYGLPRLGRLTPRSMPLAGWAYVGWALLSAVWAIDAATAWTQVSTLLQLFLIAFLVADAVVHEPSIIKPVLWVYSLSAAAASFVGLLAYVGSGSTTVRATVTQEQDPAQFAAVLLPAVVFGLYEAAAGQRRVVGGLIALLGTAGIVVSGTRGAWVSLVFVLLLFVLPRLQLRQQIAAIATVVVVVVGILQLPGTAELLADRSGNALSTGGAGRTDIWTVGLTIYETAPVLGVGFGNFPVAYTTDVIRATDVSAASSLLVGRAPHNLVIGTAVELGAIGLLLLALFLAPLVLRRGWGPNAPVVQASLASLLTAALFVDILANRKHVWLLIGMAAGLAYLKRRLAERVDAASEHRGRPSSSDGPTPTLADHAPAAIIGCDTPASVQRPPTRSSRSG
jgi:O-antigen ligase